MNQIDYIDGCIVCGSYLPEGIVICKECERENYERKGNQFNKPTRGISSRTIPGGAAKGNEEHRRSEY